MKADRAPQLKAAVRHLSLRIALISASLRISEFAGGIATGLLGLFLYVYISVEDAQLHTPIGFSTYVLAFIMMVLPGVIVFIGSYVQTIRRKVWGVALVFIGGLGSLFLIVLNAGLAYALVQDQWGQRAVLADFAAVMFTMATALVNVLLVVPTSNKRLQPTPR